MSLVSAPPTDRIVDRHGRTFDYLRIAVTDACNLRCVYCMPEKGMAFTPRKELLTTREILRIVRVTAGLGIRKVRYTGGEPLVRKDVVALVAGARETPGVERVHLTTNGVLFPPLGRELAAAGLSGVNVSLDTLDAERFERITRRTGVGRVLEAIDVALASGLRSVKVNVVSIRGFNDDEIPAFAAFTRDRAVTVRFIELMPFDAHQIFGRGTHLPATEILSALRAAHPDLETTTGSATEHHAFRAPGHAGKIAVIPAYTRTLCGACNRVRLTPDGKIRSCLYSPNESDVRGPLRDGASDETIGALFRRAMWAKARDGHAAQRETSAASGKRRESMTEIGG